MVAAGAAACLPEETPGSGRSDEVASSEQTVLDEGSDAGPIADGAYPWLVGVGNCGGALVASNVVLTAAHCVDLHFADYEDGFENNTVPFAGSSGETVVAVNGSDELGDAVFAMSVAGQAGPAIAHPAFAGGMEGSDLAVVVFEEAIPRHLLTPARVAASWDTVSSTSLLLSTKTHRLEGAECVMDSLVPTFLRASGVTGSTDDDDLPYWEFSTSSSHSCRGDSGSPIYWNGKLVSLVSTGNHADHHSGPALSLDVRSWLVANALDRDGDGWEAWEDMCDTHANWPTNRSPQDDLDGDGVTPPCDPCPLVAQEWLYDADGDEIVDCLDPCVDDPGLDILQCRNTEHGESGDCDGDGLCDGADPCPLVANVVPVENANLEAEDAWSAQALPDACDPVLIPKGAIDTSRSTAEVLQSIQTTFYKATTWIQKDDWVTRKHMASRNVTSEGPDQVSVPGVTTHARFCQPGQLNPDCLDPALIDEDELRLDLAAPSDETEAMPYHRVTLGSAVRGDTFVRSYDDTAESLQWRYDIDEAFWEYSGVVIVPQPESHPMFPGASASGLDGTMWFHAASPVGHPGSPSNDVETGVHLAEENIDDTAQLASHYFMIDPERIRHTERHFPLELDQPILAWRDLPRWPDESIFWGVDPLDDVMIFETTSHTFGYLTGDGLLQPLGDAISSGLQNRMLEPGNRWLRSEESWAHRAAEGAPLAVVLDEDGTTVADAVYASADGRQLMTSREAGHSVTGAVVGPASGFEAAYARSLGAAFRVGGTTSGSTTGGAPAGVWRFDVAPGTAFELYTGMTLGTVQSVTFDAVARELVVLDRVAGRLPGTADLRLVRIDAFGRGARVVQTWRQDGRCSRYHLLVDGRGRLVLAGSKDRDFAHAVYALSGESKSFTSRRLAAAPGTLASVPWSNEKVVYMPVEDASTGAVTLGRIDLAGDGVVADVAECL